MSVMAGIVERHRARLEHMEALHKGNFEGCPEDEYWMRQLSRSARRIEHLRRKLRNLEIALERIKCWPPRQKPAVVQHSSSSEEENFSAFEEDGQEESEDYGPRKNPVKTWMVGDSCIPNVRREKVLMLTMGDLNGEPIYKVMPLSPRAAKAALKAMQK